MNRNGECPPQCFRLATVKAGKARTDRGSSEYAKVIYTCNFTELI